ncbi:MAG: YdcF family protein [Cyanobacteriota bacterium]
MLDPAVCDRSLSHWLVFKRILFHWVMTPGGILLLLALAIALSWLILRERWKHYALKGGIVVLVIYALTSIPLTSAIANKGLVALVPADTGVSVDAIVVLGRGDQFRQSRVEVAAQLWRTQRAPLIFASGRGDAAQLMQLLEAEGIPKQALAYEDCSRTTEENARFTATMLQPQGVKSILLVTDPPHILRSLLTFRHFGFTVIPHTSPIPPDLSPRRKTLMVFYEYLGLISYGLQGRLFPSN